MYTYNLIKKNIYQKIKTFISKKIIKKNTGWKIPLNTYYTEKTFKELFSI